MTMEFGDKEKKLLLGVIIIVCIGLSIKFAWIDLFTNKTKEIKDECDVLQVEYDKLLEYHNNEKKYKREIDEYNSKINAIIKKYAANDTQEYHLMFLRALETDANWINVYNLPNDPTLSSPVSTMDSSTYVYVTAPINIEFNAPYGDTKAFIRSVNDNVKKCGFSNISLSFDDNEKIVKGKALFNMYAIVGGDRVAEQVNIFSVLYGKVLDGLFSSSTFSPDMSSIDQNSASKIRNNSDFFVLCNAYGSSLDNIVAGFTNDKSGKYLLTANGNDKHTVVIKVAGSNNNYTIEFQVDNQKQNATPFVAGETIDILVSSALRSDDIDKVSTKLRVENTSDRTVNMTVINDDPVKSRIDFEHSGAVVIY